jgi:hypothetical protein
VIATIRPQCAEPAALDREHAILELATGAILPHDLPDRYERELIGLGAEALRRAMHQVDAAVQAAVALRDAEATATTHVLMCAWCRRWRRWRWPEAGSFRCCTGFRRLSRALDYLHQGYRRAARRIGGS